MEITRRNFLTGAAAMGGLAAFGLAGCAPKSVQADADEALAETGGETSATATEGAEVTPEPTPDATVDADVVVIGGGASGLCAAISAAQNGAKVVLFEKQAQLGGNGMMPEGLFAVNSPKQAELGIESPRKIDIIANSTTSASPTTTGRTPSTAPARASRGCSIWAWSSNAWRACSVRPRCSIMARVAIASR